MELKQMLVGHRTPGFGYPNFWTCLRSKPEGFPYDYLLYVGRNKDSKTALRITGDLLWGKTKAINTQNTSQCGCGERHSPPILLSLNGTLSGGLAHVSLKEIKYFLRSFIALGGRRIYCPTIDYNQGRVLCFDEHSKLIFNSEIADAPFPVADMLKKHWYVKKIGLSVFHELAVWHLGKLADIQRKVGSHGHFIQANPPAVLFADELYAFSKGTGLLMSHDHGCAYCVDYDGYFNINGNLYRIFGYLQD